jgi:catechol 2,3-dioxygenase-like lactoylglutathione lyase family enzyme
MTTPNATVIIPLLQVTSMERSLAFYTEGLGFSLKNKWTPDDPDKIRWAWLTLGTAHVMLQEPRDLTKLTSSPIGNGVSLYIQCTDALDLYRDLLTRDIAPSREPQVGNGNWEIFYTDPDGYKINLASPTDVAEETLLSHL